MNQMIETQYEDEPDDSLDEFTALHVSGDHTIDEVTTQILQQSICLSLLLFYRIEFVLSIYMFSVFNMFVCV
jgi:hypothetical protein